EFCGLLDRKIDGFRSVENFGDVDTDSAVHHQLLNAVGHQPARFDVAPEHEHSGQAVFNRQCGNLGTVFNEERTRQDEHHLRAAPRYGLKCRAEIVWRLLELSGRSSKGMDLAASSAALN